MKTEHPPEKNPKGAQNNVSLHTFKPAMQTFALSILLVTLAAAQTPNPASHDPTGSMPK
ncbi:MAG: hypothetical protein K1X67_15215 [Fimbriimonadaceae bacterium]|nr:hypothetical protein [Fimbriimonadaceae bacterium]